jgi:signal transduction histidine kinase
MNFLAKHRRLDLQTKVVLILILVILPTYLVIIIIQNQLIRPLLEQDIRQLGITTADALAAEIVSNKIYLAKDPSKLIETRILDRLYYQPTIIRMDVFLRDGVGTDLKWMASSVDEDPSTPPPVVSLSDTVESELVTLSEGVSYWRIQVPIKLVAKSKKSPPRILGMVHLLVSTRNIDRILTTFWRVTGVAASINVVILIVLLNYFLRKTILNERLLIQAESQNLELSEQLHDTQRKMMNVEKLAVMGELTASFAHEIGTPLNAIGGHLQLLKEDLSQTEDGKKSKVNSSERLEIISGELIRIEQIVKTFLQTTAKPDSQRQLVDLNPLVDKAMGVLRPRVDGLGIDLRAELDRTMGPVRVVPTDIEQILLNLMNNSLDSLQTKLERGVGASRLKLTISTQVNRTRTQEWAELIVYDTGIGISRSDLKNVSKPFFTTKRAGEGTGLGLTICQQLASKYGGMLEIKSKEGVWTQATLRIPYRANV